MQPREPTLVSLPNPALRYFLATRPAFLSVTLMACLIGFATAFASGISVSVWLAATTLVFALLAHAGINVLNDYYDARNGTDAINTERVFPYTGGGVGEFCVAFGFGLIVIGADYVQRGDLRFTPVAAAVSYALLVANILYMNQFPDRTADAQAGKRHWEVRLPLDQARWGYALIAIVAYLWLAAVVAIGVLPSTALLALIAAPLSVMAARGLLRHAHAPQQLRVPIERTIAAACAHGALLAVGWPRLLK